MLFDINNWKRFIDGYFVRDCSIGFEGGRIGLLLFEELDEDQNLDDGWKIRLLAIKINNPLDTRFFSMSANALGIGSQISSAWHPNQAEFVCAGIGREVYSYKPKEYKGREPDIIFDGRGYGYKELGAVGSGVNKVVRVGGTVFAVGAPMRVWERTAGQQWLEHKDIPIPDDLKLGRTNEEITAALSRCPLNDMAGLSTEDMVAVGAAGVVWRRVGRQWRQLAIPTNLDLHTVAISPDGMIYITDLRGSVWAGRDDQWERIVKADRTLPYFDSVWFDNRLWCTNDSAGCYVLEGKRMVAAHQAKTKPMPSQVALHAHRLDVAPDGKTLLVAGMHGATLYDGNTWTVLFDGEPDA